MQVLAKIIINKNLFNKVKSFCLHFVNKSDFGWLSSVHQTKNWMKSNKYTCLTFRNHILILTDITPFPKTETVRTKQWQ